MKIAVIDGKGGGLGRILIHKIKALHNKNYYVIAIGINEIALLNMNKAQPDKGYFGEDVIAKWCSKVDIIIGPIGIIVPNSMLGEVTPTIANCISTSNAKKIMLPINKCSVFIPGTLHFKISYMVDMATKMLADII